MFRGSIVALVTPLLNDKVDVERLRELVEYHIESGTHAIVGAGTTGESGTLSVEEKNLVIKTIIEQADERIPVIAGTHANSTKECIERTRAAQALGAHAALIMTPAYIKPTQAGLCEHYRQIASAVAMPIILYNVPSRTACDLLPNTVAKLADISNIIGIKDASGDFSRIFALLDACQDNIDVFSGDDISGAQWMLSGAKGVISVAANVVPKLMAKLCDAALDKNHDLCLSIHQDLLPLYNLLFTETNPIPTKMALYKMGMISDEIRLPLLRLADEYHANMDNVLRNMSLVS